MITARLGGHDALESDDEVMRLISAAGVLNNTPKGDPFCRIGLLSPDGEPYRIVIAYSEGECSRIKQALAAGGLAEDDRKVVGFDCLYSTP